MNEKTPLFMTAFMAVAILGGAFSVVQNFEESNNVDGIIYGGYGHIKLDDGDRLKFEETIHNRLVDTGEDFIIDQVFQDGGIVETVDTDLVSSICVTLEGAFTDTDEAETASTFDTNDGLTETNCIEDTTVTQSSQTALIGALTFTGGTHVGAGDTITGIGICQGSASSPFNQCADAQAGSSGILFATFNISDVTLQSAETVDIDYTFDISTASS